MGCKKYGRAWTRIRHRYVKSHPFCELCAIRGVRTPTEEVHHLLPVSLGGSHADENLLALCHACHVKLHKTMSEFESE